MSVDVKRYAQDLFELARQENRENTFFQQLKRVNDAVNTDEDLRKYIDDPQYSAAEKKAMVVRTFHGVLDDDVVNTFFHVNDSMPRTHTELELLHEFLGYCYEINGMRFGQVYSVRPLSADDIRRIESAISGKLGQEVRLENKIDESLLGGVKVVVGENIWDGSYKARLDKLKKELLDQPIDLSGTPQQLTDTLLDSVQRYDKQNDIDLQNGDNVGKVTMVADGIVRISGLNKAMAGELLKIGEASAMVMNLEEESVGAVLLSSDDAVEEGSRVLTTGEVVRVPVGDALLGRVVDALGRPIDGRGAIHAETAYPIERPAPGVIDRQSVNEPLETGLLVIDSMIPIGKGQRELIIGDRQTGKTAIAIDTILNQQGKDVKCIYVAIGQKTSYVAQIVERLRAAGAMNYTTVVCSSAADLASLQYIAPYAGCAIGEYWMEHGEDVLIVYDDLSKHAVAYRTLSLLLRRPPGRKAYPGDVFYLHSRLLERAAKLSDALGGGSLTALPIVETQAGDISAYIPTNVISITDGQIFLQTELFNSGFRPAVDSGLSVSRVGSAAQSKAMKRVSSSLKLELAQYQEVLDFAQFGSDLDPVTKRTINHGQRLMALLKQPQYAPLSTEDQVMLLLAGQQGLLEDLSLTDLAAYKTGLLNAMHNAHGQLVSELRRTRDLTPALQQRLLEAMGEYTDRFRRTQVKDHVGTD